MLRFLACRSIYTNKTDTDGGKTPMEAVLDLSANWIACGNEDFPPVLTQDEFCQNIYSLLALNARGANWITDFMDIIEIIREPRFPSLKSLNDNLLGTAGIQRIMRMFEGGSTDLCNLRLSEVQLKQEDGIM